MQGIPNPRTHPTLSWIKFKIEMVTKRPAVNVKYHQLKNELLAFLSSGCSRSNWSAPKAWTHGLCPPCASATRYREKKNKINWSPEPEESTVLTGRIAENVNKPSACNLFQSKLRWVPKHDTDFQHHQENFNGYFSRTSERLYDKDLDYLWHKPCKIQLKLKLNMCGKTCKWNRRIWIELTKKLKHWQFIWCLFLQLMIRLNPFRFA